MIFPQGTHPLNASSGSDSAATVCDICSSVHASGSALNSDNNTMSREVLAGIIAMALCFAALIVSELCKKCGGDATMKGRYKRVSSKFVI